MRRLILAFFATLMLLATACQQQTTNQDSKPVERTSTDIFLGHFGPLKGKSFAGKQVFASVYMESWAEKQLSLKVVEAGNTLVLLQLTVDGDDSRTWIISRENGAQLSLRHEQLKKGDAETEPGMYGGFAAKDGNGLQQFFPADEFTCNLLPAICNNTWVVQFDDKLSTLSYLLFKEQELVFRLDFDLMQ